MALWADVHYAFDRQWWDVYHSDVVERFKGRKASANKVSHSGVELLEKPDFITYGNSGADAIALAIYGGASRVILLGYDCQVTNGLAHWHGDHKHGLSNAHRMPLWAKKFEALANRFPEVEVLNCSRATALSCFPVANLDGVVND